MALGLLGLALPVCSASAAATRKPREAASKPRAESAATPKPAEEPERSPLYRATRPMFRWEFPKVLSEVEVPEEFETNGIPNRFRTVVVALNGEQAYQFFNESFVRQGLYVAPPKNQMEMGPGQVALTGYDPDRKISYTVFLTPYDDGTTHVIVGEAYFAGREFTAQNPFVPLVAGGEGLVTQNLESGRSVAYKVKSTPVEVTTFYSQIFRDRGYEKQPDGTWTRGPSTLHLVVKPSAQGPQWVDVGLLEYFGPGGR